jgi:hypothetical protein
MKERPLISSPLGTQQLACGNRVPIANPTTIRVQRERPILFSAPMVRAILAGTKTQTRRVVSAQPPAEFPYALPDVHGHCLWHAGDPEDEAWPDGDTLRCKHGLKGDRLWVQESYHVLGHGAVGPCLTVKYLADGAVRTVEVSPETYEKFRARKTAAALGGRFMYRDISRMALELVRVGVERLSHITCADAIAEGIEATSLPALSGTFYRDYALKNHDPFEWYSSPVESYRSLWESINGAGSWAANPWVWVIEFRRNT